MEMKTNRVPDFYVRDVPIYGRIILAPMDGVSDKPFRNLAKKFGSAMSYTEFINAIDIIQGHPDIPRRLEFTEQERPVVFQIFDDDPVRIVDAAGILLAYSPDILDVNLGCSAKCVTNRGAGAALLRNPDTIARIFRNLVNTLPIPVTGKIRLGWDDQSLNYLDIARIIQDNGGSLIAVHGRTRMQGYTGSARWDPIREIKQTVKIPVIANGDITATADIEAVMALTGCDAVMIGRAALGNPWIFSGRDRDQIQPSEVKETLLYQLNSMLDYYGRDRGLVLFRKYAKRLLEPYNLERSQLIDFLTTLDPDRFILNIEGLFAQIY